MLGNILKSGGIFGALAGLMFTLLFFTLIAIQTPLSSMLYRFDLAFMIFFVYLGIYYFRYYLNYGEMKFWQGLTIGSLVALIGALFISFSVKIYLDPNISQVLEKDLKGTLSSINQVDSSGNVIYIEKYGKEAFDQQVAELAEITPAFIVKDKFSSVAGVGLLFSLVFSIFLRKSYDEQT